MLRRDDREREGGKINSVVGSGTKVNGDCEVDGTIRIDGELEGRLKVSKLVIIGKTGLVKGDIESAEVVIGGKVFGTITGESRIELQAGAHIEGDLRTKSLIVDEGVFFHGNCRMKEEEAKAFKVLEGDGLEKLRINN